MREESGNPSFGVIPTPNGNSPDLQPVSVKLSADEKKICHLWRYQ